MEALGGPSEKINHVAASMNWFFFVPLS